MDWRHSSAWLECMAGGLNANDISIELGSSVQHITHTLHKLCHNANTIDTVSTYKVYSHHVEYVHDVSLVVN